MLSSSSLSRESEILARSGVAEEGVGGLFLLIFLSVMAGSFLAAAVVFLMGRGLGGVGGSFFATGCAGGVFFICGVGAALYCFFSVDTVCMGALGVICLTMRDLCGFLGKRKAGEVIRIRIKMPCTSRTKREMFFSNGYYSGFRMTSSCSKPANSTVFLTV